MLKLRNNSYRQAYEYERPVTETFPMWHRKTSLYASNRCRSPGTLYVLLETLSQIHAVRGQSNAEYTLGSSLRVGHEMNP